MLGELKKIFEHQLKKNSNTLSKVSMHARYGEANW